jgi:acyl-CoA reductase-like NAD-dependent aldehyde dehydrogenase
VAEALAAGTDSLADLITHEVGMPRILSQIVQVGLPPRSLAAAAPVATDLTWEQTVGNSLIVREPIGAVGCITPGTIRSTRSPPW